MVRTTLLIATLAAAVPSLASAYGEAGTTEQSLEERALHFYTDQLRVDPSATDSAFDELPAVRPLVLADELAAASRFYADDMGENGCFPADHSSCDGTSFSERVGSFYSGGAFGENIAKGQPSAESAVFQSWLYSDGHRANMLDGDWNEIGTGHAEAGPIWVQDFGFRPGIEEPIVTSATHEPLRPTEDSSLLFYAAVFDPEGESLRAMTLVVEDTCQAMETDRGGGGMETWSIASDSGTAGCVRYFFAALRVNGEEAAYPTQGSLQVPVGDSECAPWVADRVVAECAPPTFGGSGSGCGGSGAGYGPDANVGGSAEYGSCALGGGGEGRGLLGLLLVAVGIRRRRRG
jgi:hypothetical protein